MGQGTSRQQSDARAAGKHSGASRQSSAVFSACLLSDQIEADGFPVAILQRDGESGSPLQGLRSLMRRLRAHPTAILHTHGYKANVVGRLARMLRCADEAGIVSTSHGFDNTGRAAALVYNVI